MAYRNNILGILGLLRALVCILLVSVSCNLAAKGRIGFLLTGDYLHSSLQETSYDEKGGESLNEIGYGLTIDYFLGRSYSHALAFDAYSFSDTVEIKDAGDVENTLNIATIGYRYHSPYGFFIGGHAGNINGESDIESDQGCSVKTTYGNTRITALSLGYAHIFSEGFALGLHFWRSIPTSLPVASRSNRGCNVDATEERENFAISTIMLSLGYAW